MGGQQQRGEGEWKESFFSFFKFFFFFNVDHFLKSLLNVLQYCFYFMVFFFFFPVLAARHVGS